MSNISGIVGGVVALALVNRLLDRKDTTAPTALIPPTAPPVMPVTPLIPTPVVKPSFDIAPIIPESAFKITPKQLEAFTPDRPVTRPVYDPKAMVAQPIRGGGPFKLNLKGSLADILQGRR